MPQTPAPKSCALCGRTIEWRKKWERDWDSVKYCSNACRRRGIKPIDEQLEQTIKQLITQRGRGKSICPSEAAKAAADTSTNPEAWRDLMEPTRMAARRLVNQGIAEITQKDKPVDPSTAKGPIRVRLR